MTTAFKVPTREEEGIQRSVGDGIEVVLQGSSRLPVEGHVETSTLAFDCLPPNPNSILNLTGDRHVRDLQGQH
ncbi:MAG: hypothetical protein ACOYMS_14700 [Terrimicrobiaceae bacterium]